MDILIQFAGFRDIVPVIDGTIRYYELPELNIPHPVSLQLRIRVDSEKTSEKKNRILSFDIKNRNQIFNKVRICTRLSRKKMVQIKIRVQVCPRKKNPILKEKTEQNPILTKKKKQIWIQPLKV